MMGILFHTGDFSWVERTVRYLSSEYFSAGRWPAVASVPGQRHRESPHLASELSDTEVSLGLGSGAAPLLPNRALGTFTIFYQKPMVFFRTLDGMSLRCPVYLWARWGAGSGSQGLTCESLPGAPCQLWVSLSQLTLSAPLWMGW